MQNTMMGQCHCGETKIEVTALAEFQFVCYCTDCRVLNSGGHLCGMLFDKSQLKEALNTQTYSYTGGSGEAIELHFCPRCATHLYAYPSAYPEKVVVRANVLIDAAFKPQQHLFCESAFHWDHDRVHEERT